MSRSASAVTASNVSRSSARSSAVTVNAASRPCSLAGGVMPAWFGPREWREGPPVAVARSWPGLVALAVRVGLELAAELVEQALDGGNQLGVLGLDRRLQQLEALLGALDVGGEVPQVGARVAVLLAGDLARRDLFDQLGRPDRQRRRRDVHFPELGLERLQVGFELVGKRGAALGGTALPQQVLEAVPAGEGGGVDAREVVHPGVDRPG